MVVLCLVLELAAEDGAGNGAYDAVAAELVAASISGCGTAHGAEQTAVAFLGVVGVGWVAGGILALVFGALGVLLVCVTAILGATGEESVSMGFGMI